MSGGMGREWRTGHDRAIEALQWGKLAAPARPRLTSLNHSFTLDLVICCRDKAADALVTMRGMMTKLKLTVNETKTRVCKLPEEKFDFFRLLRVPARAMPLAQDGTSLSRQHSVEETGATRL